VEIALRSHPDLRTAEARMKQASFEPALATAHALPQAGAQYYATRQKETLTALIEGPSTPLLERSQTFTYQQGRFQLDQLLLDFGRTLSLLRAAQADFRGKAADRDTAAAAVVLGVKEAYYTLIAANRLLQVAERTEDRDALILRVTQNRFETGLAPRFDILRQEANLATAQVNVVTARNNVDLARETLRDAMGLEAPIAFEPNDNALEYRDVPLDEQRALEQAYAHRPEIVGAAARREAAKANVAAVERQYFPVAAGRADYTFSGSSAQHEGWQIGSVIKLSVFDGGTTAAQLGQARAELLGAEADERRQRQSVTLDVRRSYLNAMRGRDAIGASSKAVASAGEAARISEHRYETGLGNIIELTSSELSFMAAQANQIRLLADYHTALADLERAIGTPASRR
jgi:outer membrane protein